MRNTMSKRCMSLLLAVLMSGILLLCTACSGGDEKETSDDQPLYMFDYTSLGDLSAYVTLSDAVLTDGVTVTGQKEMSDALYNEWLGNLLLEDGKTKYVTDRPVAEGDIVAFYYKGVFVNEDGSETVADGFTSMDFANPMQMEMGGGSFEDGLIGVTPADTYWIDTGAAVTAETDIVCVTYSFTFVPYGKENEVTNSAERFVVDLKYGTLIPEALKAFTGKNVGETYSFDLDLDLSDSVEGAETPAHCEMTVHGIVRMQPTELYTTVPENYTAKPEYAGREIKFYAWVAGIVEPDFDALTAEYVRDVLGFEAAADEKDIVAAYKEKTREELAAEYEKTRQEVVLEAIQAVIKESAVYHKLPEDAVTYRSYDLDAELVSARSYYENLGKKFESNEEFVRFYYSIKDDEQVDISALLRSKAEDAVKDDLLFFRFSEMCGLSVGEKELSDLLAERLNTLAEKYSAEDQTGKVYTPEEAKAKYESIYGKGFAEYTLEFEILQNKLNDYLLKTVPVTYTGN